MALKRLREQAHKTWIAENRFTALLFAELGLWVC